MLLAVVVVLLQLGNSDILTSAFCVFAIKRKDHFSY
jgi:hypothetical protein